MNAPERRIHVFEAVRRQPWRYYVLAAAATVALNVAFVLAVNQFATSTDHLTVTLDGPSVTAQLNGATLSKWEGASDVAGGIGIEILEPRFGGSPAGVANLAITELPSGEGGATASGAWQDAASWQPQTKWYVDWRGRLLTPKLGKVRIDETVRDGVIDIDLINSQRFNVLVRAQDPENGLLLRWDGSTLSWSSLTAGQVGRSHGVARRHRLTSQERHDKYGAQFAAYLLPGYFDGLRFAWRYARDCGPGLLFMLVLGVLWRGRTLLPKRETAPAPRRSGTRWGRGIIALSIALAAAAALFYWWPTLWWPTLQAAPLPSITALLLATVTAALFTLIVREIFRMRAREPRRFQVLGAVASWSVVFVIAGAATVYSLYAAIVYLDGIPHVQDSVSYLLAAKAILAGQLKIPIDQELAPFFEYHHWFSHYNGYLYPLIRGWYFAGFPSLLALGLLIDAPWLVNPVIGGITLAVLFLLCRELFSTSTGLIAVALAGVSPFARFLSASMMSQPAALLFVTATLLLLVYWLKRGRAVYAVGAGICLGALFNIRTFDGLVLAGFIALVLLVRLPRLGLQQTLRGSLVAAIAAAPFALLLLWQIDILGAERPLQNTSSKLVGWTPEKIDATRIRLASLNEDLFGLTRTARTGVPRTLTIGLLLLAVLVVPKTRADWFIVGWALLYPAAYALYPGHGVMFGPRYWYPSLGGQVVIIARVLQILPALVTRLSCVLWPPGRSRRWHWLPFAVGAVPMILITVPLFLSVLGYAYPGHYKRMYSSDYNGFRPLPQELLAQHGVKKGLVFIAETSNWQDFLTAVAANDASLSGNLIFARHLEGRDHLLMKAHPNHTPYVITWNGFEAELSRLSLDPESNSLTRHSPTSDTRNPLVVGKSNVFQGLRSLGGRPLVGGLDTNRRGDIYVLDEKSHQILVFDKEGTLQRRIFMSYSFGPEAISQGDGITVDEDDNIYVTDLDPPALLRFNADGTFAWRVDRSPDGKQRLRAPYEVATLPDGNLIVVDASHGSKPGLHIIRPDGSFAGYFGGDKLTVKFDRPVGVAVGPNGHVYVSDAGLKALIELDEHGGEVRRWPLNLKRWEPYHVPYVALDARGNVYVVDTIGWVVHRARPNSATLEEIDTRLEWPSGVATRGDELLVIESFRRRIRSLNPG